MIYPNQTFDDMVINDENDGIVETVEKYWINLSHQLRESNMDYGEFVKQFLEEYQEDFDYYDELYEELKEFYDKVPENDLDTFIQNKTEQERILFEEETKDIKLPCLFLLTCCKGFNMIAKPFDHTRLVPALNFYHEIYRTIECYDRYFENVEFSIKNINLSETIPETDKIFFHQIQFNEFSKLYNRMKQYVDELRLKYSN